MQFEKVCEEASEVYDAWTSCDEYVDDVVAELLDTIHACETGLRMLEEFFYVDVDKIAMNVIQKNADRGYYDERTWTCKQS